MLGFRGYLDGEVINDAVEFVIKSRESDELVPIEAIWEIMGKLTTEQLLDNNFTIEELRGVDLSGFNIVLEPKEVQYCDECCEDDEWGYYFEVLDMLDLDE